MKRGDIVTIAAGAGFGGKPRPALIIQSDDFDRLATLTVAMFTSKLVGREIARPRFEPAPANGLRETSELMVDIIVTVRRERVGSKIGVLAPAEMVRVDRGIILFLGLAA